MTRRFVDAPTGYRCTAAITLKDGSTAQCGRWAANKGQMLCTQHYKIQAARPASGLAQELKTLPNYPPST